MGDCDVEIEDIEQQIKEIESAMQNDENYTNPKWLEQKESLFDFIDEEAS